MRMCKCLSAVCLFVSYSTTVVSSTQLLRYCMLLFVSLMYLVDYYCICGIVALITPHGGNAATKNSPIAASWLPHEHKPRGVYFFILLFIRFCLTLVSSSGITSVERGKKKGCCYFFWKRELATSNFEKHYVR